MVRARTVAKGLVIWLIIAPITWFLFAAIGATTGPLGLIGGTLIGFIVAAIIAVSGFIVTIYGLLVGPIETKHEVIYKDTIEDRLKFETRPTTPSVVSYLCPSCGKQIAPYSKFCSSCGTKLKWS